MARVMKRLREGGKIDQKRQDAQKRLEKAETEGRRLVDAIKQGGNITMLVQAVKEQEQKASQLRAEIEQMAEVKMWDQDDGAKVRARFAVVRKEWQTVLGKHPAAARTALRKLLVDKITWTPQHHADGAKGCTVYVFEAEGRIDAALRGTADPHLLRTDHPRVLSRAPPGASRRGTAGGRPAAGRGGAPG
jgi:hypothetical protein